MDNGAQLLALARRLRDAAACQDWEAVGDLDREVAALVASLAKVDQPSAAERTAFDALHRVHTAARLQCEVECARLATGLTELQTHKEGWLAYGMNEESREERA